MKISFLEPANWIGPRNIDRVFGCNLVVYPFPNVISLTSAATLEQAGHDVRYVDAATEDWSEARFEAFLGKDDSDLYILHGVNLSRSLDLYTIDKIRQERGPVPIVFTGPGPTQFAKLYLRDEQVYVVRGEPEHILPQLVAKIERDDREGLSQVLGISYMSNGAPHHSSPAGIIQDLDQIPYPARHLLNPKLYHNPKLLADPWTMAIASRGCYAQCIYCVPPSLDFARELEFRNHNASKKPPVRRRSVENLLGEMRLLNEQGYRSLTFMDSTFILGKKRTIDFCKGMEPLGFQWNCETRADTITEEVAAAMAAAGCVSINIGVESFNQEVLDYVKKGMRVESIYRALEILERHKIEASINILIGATPWQTEEMIMRDVEEVRRLKPGVVMFSIVSPFPGTEYYDTVKANGWFAQGDYFPNELQQTAIVNYPTLGTADLERIIRKATYRFYLSPAFFLKHWRKVLKPKNLAHSVRALVNKLNFVYRHAAE